MEFLIAKGFHNNPTKELTHDLIDNVSFRGEKETLAHVDDDFFLFSHGSPLIRDNKTYLFDGNAFFNDIFLHTLLDNNLKDIEAIFNALEANKMNDISGVFCILQIDLKTKQFRLYTDPLSQYPIVSWQSNGKYVVSNNIFLIEKYLQAQGRKLEREPLCMLRNSIAILNLSLTTPFKDVSYQPPRTVLTGGETLTRKELFTWEYLCTPPNTYDECIIEAADRLTKKCNALFKAMPDYYYQSDITGGIDSRLILSALMASGYADKVKFWCNTRYPHPDANVADHIISRYGLQQGITMINRVNEEFTLEQSIKRGLFRNRGARYKDWSGLGKGYFPKMVRLTGSFGEIGRSNVLTKLFENPGSINNFKAKTIQHMKKVGSLDLITEQGQHQLADPIQDTVMQMENMNIPRNCMSDMLYIDGRGRYHFGHYLACTSGLFISPCLIYDINIIWANIHLNNTEKVAGKAQFDLIRMLGGDELVEIPLADKRWSPAILPADMKKRLKNIEIITRNSSALPAKKNTMTWRPGWAISENKVIKPKTRPVFAKGRSLAWAQLPEYQEIAKNLLHKTKGNEDFFKYIDRGKLQELIATPPETVKKEWTIWALQNVVAGLMWALGKEDRTPISVEFKGKYPS